MPQFNTDELSSAAAEVKTLYRGAEAELLAVGCLVYVSAGTTEAHTTGFVASIYRKGPELQMVGPPLTVDDITSQGSGPVGVSVVPYETLAD